VATGTATLVIAAPVVASTSVVITPRTDLVGSIIAGTKVADVVVQPPGWTGVIASTNAAFQMQGMNMVAVGAIGPGTYSLSATATP